MHWMRHHMLLGGLKVARVHENVHVFGATLGHVRSRCNAADGAERDLSQEFLRVHREFSARKIHQLLDGASAPGNPLFQAALDKKAPAVTTKAEI